MEKRLLFLGALASILILALFIGCNFSLKKNAIDSDYAVVSYLKNQNIKFTLQPE